MSSATELSNAKATSQLSEWERGLRRARFEMAAIRG